MFFLGHLGIGTRIVSRFSTESLFSFVLLGTITPDLIDKPLYYLLSWYTGKKGMELGLISGGRTFAHTGVFLLSLGVLSQLFQSKKLKSLCFGIATHFLLDCTGSSFYAPLNFELVRRNLFWPFSGWKFPTIPYSHLVDHLNLLDRPLQICAEGVGLIFLIFELKKASGEKKTDSHRSTPRE